MATLDPAEELNKWVSEDPATHKHEEEDKQGHRPQEHDYLKQAKGNSIERMIQKGDIHFKAPQQRKAGQRPYKEIESKPTNQPPTRLVHRPDPKAKPKEVIRVKPQMEDDPKQQTHGKLLINADKIEQELKMFEEMGESEEDSDALEEEARRNYRQRVGASSSEEEDIDFDDKDPKAKKGY